LGLSLLRLIILVEKAELRELGESVAEGITRVLKVDPVIRWYRGPSPKAFFNTSRRQCRADKLMNAVIEEYRVSSSERLIAILDQDAYVPGLNFVFGLARPGWGGLVFLSRLKPEFYGSPPSLPLLRSRVTKVSIHELGHSLGLGHCRNNLCVMRFDNTVYEVDAKTYRFCVRCVNELETLHPGLVRLY